MRYHRTSKGVKVPARRLPQPSQLRGLGLFVFLLATIFLALPPALGQFRGEFFAGDQDSDLNEDAPPAAAVLNTDPELEYRLRRADELAAQGEYVAVIPLWQSALDTASDILVTRDGVFYRPVTLQIEDTIRSLPEHALRAYRLSADGLAAVLLAEAKNPEEREAALKQVVQRYFLSTYGDEAAYELACHALDRHNYIYANHLLTKVLNEYPDPTVERADVLLRLAVVQAELGDRSHASGCLEQYLDIHPEVATSPLLQSISQAIQEVPATAAARAEPGVWRMSLGTLAGDGVAPAVPEALTQGELVELWHHDFRTGSAISRQISDDWSKVEVIPGEALPHDGENLLHDDMVYWKTAERSRSRTSHLLSASHPRGQLLFDQGRVYFKTVAGLVCADARTGQILWRGMPSFFADDKHTLMYLYMSSRGATRSPSADRLRLYGDRTNEGMAIDDGQIFSIEGNAEKNSSEFDQNDLYEFMQTGIPRTRSNCLTAYDTVTGKVLWRFPGGREFYRKQSSGNDASDRLGFMGPPVPYNRTVLAPVSEDEALWLCAIDRDSGELLWRTFLCEELPSASDPWSPVGIAVEGGEAYVSTGASAVVALDARTGDIRWALHYDPTTEFNGFRGFYGDFSLEQNEDIWEENLAIIHGRALIILASDSNTIQARDRRDGSLLWESPIAPGNIPANYCLGVLNSRLYVAGPNVVRCIELVDEAGDVTNGRIAWERFFQERTTGLSYGHGVLTPDAIYVPVRDTIVELDPLTGEVLEQIAVRPPPDIPVSAELEFVPAGSLYSDGRWLHTVSPKRVAALGTAALREEAWEIPLESQTEEDDEESPERSGSAPQPDEEGAEGAAPMNTSEPSEGDE